MRHRYYILALFMLVCLIGVLFVLKTKQTLRKTTVITPQQDVDKTKRIDVISRVYDNKSNESFDALKLREDNKRKDTWQETVIEQLVSIIKESDSDGYISIEESMDRLRKLRVENKIKVLIGYADKVNVIDIFCALENGAELLLTILLDENIDYEVREKLIERIIPHAFQCVFSNEISDPQLERIFNKLYESLVNHTLTDEQRKFIDKAFSSRVRVYQIPPNYLAYSAKISNPELKYRMLAEIENKNTDEDIRRTIAYILGAGVYYQDQEIIGKFIELLWNNNTEETLFDEIATSLAYYSACTGSRQIILNLENYLLQDTSLFRKGVILTDIALGGKRNPELFKNIIYWADSQIANFRYKSNLSEQERIYFIGLLSCVSYVSYQPTFSTILDMFLHHTDPKIREIACVHLIEYKDRHEQLFPIYASIALNPAEDEGVRIVCLFGMNQMDRQKTASYIEILNKQPNLPPKIKEVITKYLSPK